MNGLVHPLFLLSPESQLESIDIYIFTFTFSHLADALIKSDLQ